MLPMGLPSVTDRVAFHAMKQSTQRGVSPGQPFAAGATVEKINSRPGSVVQDGTRGVVLEAEASSQQEGMFAYAVRFEGRDQAQFISGGYLRAALPERARESAGRAAA